MATFTEELKNEIIAQKIKKQCCRIAFLSAFIRTSGSIIYRNGNYGFEFITENEQTASYICGLFASAFGIQLTLSGSEYDLKSGKDKYKIEYFSEDSCDVLHRLGLLKVTDKGISLVFNVLDKIVREECCKASYIKGAFLGGGSCTLPEEQTYSRTGYHFEIIFSNKYTAGDFCDILCYYEILAKLVVRKDSVVVYAKSNEVICDILSVMQVENSIQRLNRIVELKDKCNNANRVSNCSVSNIDKAVKASVAQIKAIEVISQTVGLQSLDKNLFEVAEARLADKNASMQELADRLGITKSCINHRMRKIVAMSSQLL
ncbi:MAG: DNA-binding protein WhiA [Candidatus Coproplasma sp.]